MSQSNQESLIFKLGEFTGPIDVLLELFKSQKLEIIQTNISLIIDQYLEFIDYLNQNKYNHAVEYIEFAVELVAYKSLLLLKEEGEEEVTEQFDGLIDKILEYKSYKEASMSIHILEEKRSKYLTTSSLILDKYKTDNTFELAKEQFYSACENISNKLNIIEQSEKDQMIVRKEDTISFYFEKLKNRKEFLVYSDLKELPNKEKILYFLATLEILKLDEFELFIINNEIVIRNKNE